jgi:catechol 2,3-dioxygenase-like lactoylglutathione lyase family enzyme
VRAAFVDHLALQVRDLEASKRFYRAALRRE